MAMDGEGDELGAFTGRVPDDVATRVGSCGCVAPDESDVEWQLAYDEADERGGRRGATVRGRLIVLSGLPGVGKSEVAQRVAARLRAVHLSIDSVEEAMLGAGLPSGWTTGVAAYEVVRAAAESNLVLGRTVVVDAVNDSEPARDTWQRAATSTAADLKWVVFTCSDVEEHRRRLGHRDRGFAFITEPSWAEVQERGENFAAWTQPHLHIDSARTAVEDAVTKIVEALTKIDPATPQRC